MNQKYTNNAVFGYSQVLDENLTWLIQMTEESKCYQKNLLPIHAHAHNEPQILFIMSQKQCIQNPIDYKFWQRQLTYFTH